MKRVILACTLLTVALAPLPAQAQHGSLTRSFVSSTGNDNNSCMITAPCQTFAVAYTKVSANGIVAALDPGKYGPLTIIGPVTVNGNGWAAITGPAQGIGININAGPNDKVTLKGLEIDGAGAAYNGIVFNSGSNLIVSNCDIENFFFTTEAINPGNGILIDPSGGTVSFSITDTLLANNGANGFLYYSGGTPTVTGTLDHVKATANTGNGVQIFAANQTNGFIAIALTNSLMNNNNDGNNISLPPASSTAAARITMDSLTVAGNATTGISVDGNRGQLLLGRSVVLGNPDGTSSINNGMTTGYGTFGTYQNNSIYPVNETLDDFQPQ